MRITTSVNTLLFCCVLIAICICSIPAFGADPAKEPRKIMLAGTIGPIDAGIVGALEAAFTKKTGVAVEHAGAGTGKALKMGSFTGPCPCTGREICGRGLWNKTL